MTKLRLVALVLAAFILAGSLPLTDLALAQTAQQSAAPDSTTRTAAADINWSQASALSDTAIVQKRFGRAAIEVTSLNFLVWFFDRYIREGGTNPGFRIGFDSWAENLTNGFEWDDNSFSTNQFSHPYHGNLYFNAARSNGFSFWESVPFAFAGSLQWEYFGEVHHASMNDWIATSIGGIALGEMLHRMALTVRDNTARGSSRTWKEIGGFALDPVGGMNRVLDGEWNRIYANPPDRLPNSYRSAMNVGFRKSADDHLWADNDTTAAYIEFLFDYGDPFAGDMENPFDHFNLDLQLNFKDAKLIGRANLNGLLAGTYLAESPRASHIIGAFHHFDYVNNSKVKFGAQSLGAGLLSRYETGHGLEIRTELHTSVLIIGGSKSDYETYSGRTYDYGPGLSAEFSAEFGANGWHFLRVSHQQYWVHSVDGAKSDHHLGATRAALNVPITTTVAGGVEYVLFTSEKNYEDFEDVSQRAPQLRLYATMMLR